MFWVVCVTAAETVSARRLATCGLCVSRCFYGCLLGFSVWLRLWVVTLGRDFKLSTSIPPAVQASNDANTLVSLPDSLGQALLELGLFLGQALLEISLPWGKPSLN